MQEDTSCHTLDKEPAMVRRFKSDAAQMRAAYLGSLLEVLFLAVARKVSAVRSAASQPAMTMAPRRVAASSWGKL
jgi:hypothetical protein